MMAEVPELGIVLVDRRDLPSVGAGQPGHRDRPGDCQRDLRRDWFVLPLNATANLLILPTHDRTWSPLAPAIV